MIVPFGDIAASSHLGLCFIDGSARNPHLTANFCGGDTCIKSGLNGHYIDLRWVPSIGPFARGCLDPFGLSLPAEIGLELGKDPEHIEECLACCSGCVHGLLRGRKMCVPFLQACDDDLEILH